MADFLSANIDLIRFMTDRVIQGERYWLNSLDKETLNKIMAFQRELEKQEITGDST